jgi:hypothetical protein
MIEWLMVFGIGLMAGCLLMLAFFPLVHRRAAESTKRDLTETEPLTASAIQADRDQLRAHFAMAVRRLEIGVEDMRVKAMDRAADKQHAEISRLQVELDKRTAMIFALRAREEVRKGAIRRIVKLLLYLFVRSKRRRAAAPPLFEVPLGQASWEFDREPDAGELASTAAAIAAVNLKRRQAVSNKH